MIRSWLRVGLCALVLCGALAAGQVRAQGDGESDAPYIYYYSNVHNAFVIERADGTDTHLLGEGVTGPAPVIGELPSAVAVSGPGWSPSGKWFAWIKRPNFQGYPVRATTVYTLSTDGQRRLTLLDDVEFDYVQAMWAQDADLLLVAGQTVEWDEDRSPEGANDILHRTIMLIDVNAGKILASTKDALPYTTAVQNHYYNLIPTLFEIDATGSFVAVWFDYGESELENGISVYRLEKSGDVAVQHITPVELMGYIGTNNTRFSLSSTGWLTYTFLDQKGTVLQNVITGEKSVIEGCGTYVAWLEGGTTVSIAGEKICLFDVNTKDLTVVSDAAYESSIFVSPPGGQVLLEFNNRGDPVMYDFRTHPATITRLSQQPEGKFYFMDITLASWQWADSSHGVMTSDRWIFAIDLDAKTLVYLDLTDASRYSVFMSPSKRYIVAVAQGAIAYDTQLGTTTPIRPAYDGWGTFVGGRVVFDDSEQWLLIFENASVAGGSGCCTIGVGRIDGTERRDLLHVGSPADTMYTWLPPQVDPADLPPALTMPITLQPARVLRGTVDAREISWSPDGKQIAAVPKGDGMYDLPFDSVLTIWDVETGAVIERRPVDDTAAGIEWVADGAGGYTAELGTGDNTPANACNIDPESVSTFYATGRSAPFSPAQFLSQALSPDGRWCMTGSAGYFLDPNAILWDTTTWKQVVTLPNSTLALAFSPDSTRIAVAASWDVQIWDVADLVAWGK
ncbi:MAG TPA: WD40 repeat domain-containing protein [Aggregatilinea sp.]|uniref:WD40 repeat domain-containing protein n=1 Tax=Aggregatilinea sp. TaxID=2806333 RepID=UPI002C385A7A|nr:WD40 repeat domain-containing protein [Aggregatilinea sp.]HML22685.1 WD40 repeat domain-containing protein [Aggregatilinea sp.]